MRNDVINYQSVCLSLPIDFRSWWWWWWWWWWIFQLFHTHTRIGMHSCRWIHFSHKELIVLRLHAVYTAFYTNEKQTLVDGSLITKAATWCFCRNWIWIKVLLIVVVFERIQILEFLYQGTILFLLNWKMIYDKVRITLPTSTSQK